MKTSGLGCKMTARYPFAAVICLLLCLSAFAAWYDEPDVPVTGTAADITDNTSVNMPKSGEEQEAELKAVSDKDITPKFSVHKVWLWQESHDCLWNLAKKYYNDPWQWKRIYLANKGRIKDPSKIYPKQQLFIPPPEEQKK